MKDGKCPKCASTDVRITKLVNTELMTGAYEFNAYLCPACGYIEHYVADPATLAGTAAGVAEGIGMTTRTRELTLTAEMLHAYSRRGNYHSEPDEARRLGLPGLVAQGLQVAGPAYRLLLDEWGEDFLAHGELELKFVGMVLDDQTVDAAVTIDGGDATIEVTNRNTGKVAVVGSVRRVGGG